MAREKKYLQFGIRQRLYQGSGCISVIPQILETEGWKRVMLIADPVYIKPESSNPSRIC